MPEPWIKTSGLHHTYGAGTPFSRVALTDVDFRLDAEEAVGIIGQTGSGKSTLLQHLNGLYRPQQGQVRVFDVELSDPDADVRAVRQRVGLVFQRPEQQLFAQYVGDDVAYGPRQLGMEDDVLRERVRWAMEAVGLGFEAFKDRLTWSLSGGEQRKVALAGVLALQPRILVLDEPTAGLDPVARQELLSHLGRLYSQGTALVVASHNMADIAALTQRVYVLNAGHIAAEGPTRQILTELKALQALGLDVPPITKIMTVLRQRGLDVPVDVLTLTEAEAVLLNWLEAADTAERAGAHG